MPTRSEYQRQYPNLSDAQRKLLHAARIATQYHAWGLSKVRTIALQPLMLSVTPTAEQQRTAQALLDASASNPRYADGILNYPRMGRDASLLAPSDVPPTGDPDIQPHGAEWAVCRHVGYHSDDVDSDRHAYAFWCLKSSAPMTLMLGGNAYAMPDGQMVVFDARIPHALLASSPTDTMVGIIASVELTPGLSARLGIAERRARNTSLEQLALMDHITINEETGDVGMGL